MSCSPLILSMPKASRNRAVIGCSLLVTLFGLLSLIIFSAPLPTASGEPLHSVTGNGDYGALISDSLFLYAPSVLQFDIQEFLETQPGPLANYTEEIDRRSWTAAESIQYNAMLFGVSPQLVLALLEAQKHILTDPSAIVPLHSEPQAISTATTTFHSYVKQLSEQALLDYDRHRYDNSVAEIAFPSGETLTFPESINAGTYAVQSSLATSLSRQQWEIWVRGPRPLFVERFSQWFGDPHIDPDRALATTTAAPSGYILPFPIGETWYYTGGPHYYGGGTPGCTAGAYCPRPWSSLDFAQPELIGCPNGYYPAHRWIVAAKSGVVIQSSQALIVIDHGDGWRTYYSHLSSADKRGTGPVNRGDPLGHPSCEVEPGGFTTGIHVHFALYQVGVGFVNLAGHSLSGWMVGETSHYNGTMNLEGAARVASIGRYNGTNDILNSGVDGYCPVSGGAILYKHANYDCDGAGAGVGYVMQDRAGFFDLPSSFNDQASSIRIPAGWSVRLYEHSGRQGASVCRNGDDADFTGNYFVESSILLNDQISSIDVFEVGDCSGPYEGGAWTVTYYDDPELTYLCAAATVLDGAYIFRDWGNESPAAGCPAGNWSARFTRHAYFPSGSFEFSLGSDDSSRLRLNGETVVDNWSGAGQSYASRTLSAGTYEVTVEYANAFGDSYLSAWWWGQGYPTVREDQQPDQWYARYWGNQGLRGDPVILLNEGPGTLNHAWGNEGPGFELPADRFGGRFERQPSMTCGAYHFQLTTDDGARFWIDGQLLLDAWFDQVGSHDIFVDLDSGDHLLKVEHYENGGLAAISLDWTRDSLCLLPEQVHLPLVHFASTPN